MAKQPTISKFFLHAKKEKGDKSSFTTDEENEGKPKQKKENKHSLKRPKDTENTSKCPNNSSFKKQKLSDDIVTNGSDKKSKVGAWTTSRLQAFSLDTGENGMEMDSQPSASDNMNGSSSQDLSPEVGVSQTESSTLQPGPLVVPKGAKLTPLELQVVDIKNKNPDVLMFVECGYKYRFFGCDAEIASKELNIQAHMDHSFMTGSIPTHRLHVHVRRLVAKGYKIGVVKQKETAALKKASGGNKSAPFTRQLSSIYTRSTLIGEDVSPGGGAEGDADVSEGETALLLVVYEDKKESKEGSVNISFVAIQPSTGDIVYDTFEDNSTRTEIWCRLDNLQPVEALVHESISSTTTNTISTQATKREDRIRIERMDDSKFEYSDALKRVCDMFEGDSEKINRVSNLASGVVCCLGATIEYLKEFNLHEIIKMAGSMEEYRQSNHHMNLSGATLRNLEVLSAETGGTKGSLYRALDHTSTKFGSRMLRRWIVQPLLNIEEITERQDIIEEILEDSPVISNVKDILQKLPDFERCLTTIFHKKCSPYEFWVAVSGLSSVHSKLSGNLDAILEIKTPALAKLLKDTIDGLANVENYASNIHETSAKEGKKTTLLRDFTDYPSVTEKQKEIAEVERKLDDLKPEICRALNLKCFQYTTVSGLEYLIEVKNSQLKLVPKKWSKISSTKALCRFRSPEIERLFQKLLQLREQLQVECHEAWISVLDSFAEQYQQHKHAVRSLASVDALISLAGVAKAHGYCRPKFISESGKLEITQGKHPIISQLKQGDEQYVANDTEMSVSGQRVMLITGPNMGGKSCYIRQVALIVIMAQMGSFVPAESVTMSIFDAVYTRMGATDEIFSGKSTFMVEVSETSDIMKGATEKSLVILDELGRGTSTHDGVAVAMGALDYFLNTIKSLTIFVTHYLPLTEFEKQYPLNVGNYHMSFIVSEEENDINVVTFLYQLVKGSAGQSYGLNVARLAEIPTNIIVTAGQKSKFLQRACTMRRKGKELFKTIIKEKNNIREQVNIIKSYTE